MQYQHNTFVLKAAKHLSTPAQPPPRPQRHSNGDGKATALSTLQRGSSTPLQQTLQHLKATQHLNLSAFCRAAITEKLQRLQQQQETLK
jgi:hypothetical protein